MNKEADKIEYFAFNDIPCNTAPKHADRIKDILDNPDKLIMKTCAGKSSIQLVEEGLL